MFHVTLFSVTTVTFFIPSALFLGNIDEFMVDYNKVFPIVLITSLVCWLAENIIGIFFSKKDTLFCGYLNLLFGITVGFYIQGNFINGNLPPLHGGVIHWDRRRIYSFISIITWGLCLLVPQVMNIIKKNSWNNFRKYSSYFFAAVQLVALPLLLLTTHRTVSNELVVTNDRQFELSKNNNIVVFLVDTLDAEYAEEYVLNDDKEREVLKDFTYFDNVVSGGAPTMLGIPTLLTGVLYDDPYNMSIYEYYEKAYNQSTLFSDLKNNNYEMHLYTSLEYLTYAEIDSVENIDRIQILEASYEMTSIRKFSYYLYRFTGYYVMPYPLKKYFVFYTGDFTQCVDARIVQDKEAYTVDDVKFYQNLCEDRLSVREDDSNLFVFYHLFGAHLFYTMNEKCERVSPEETSLGQQIQGDFNIIADYLEQMKELGVYDTSTIIIAADHGSVDLFQNPAVFIKKAYEQNQDVTYNSAPATFINVRASIADAFLADYSSYGPSLFDDLSENDRNGRYHTAAGAYRTNKFSNETTGYSFDRYKIGNPARDTNLIEDANPYK